MAKFNKPNGKTGSITLVSAIFLLLGIAFLVVGYNVQILSWFKTFGIVFLVVAVPVLVWILYTAINNKIKEM